MANEHNDQIRIVQETVAGKEITFAHVMGGPAPIIYQKLGLNPQKLPGAKIWMPCPAALAS